MKLALSPKIQSSAKKPGGEGDSGWEKGERSRDPAFATPILNPSRIHMYLQWVDSRFAIFSVKTAAKPIKPRAKGGSERERIERSIG